MLQARAVRRLRGRRAPSHTARYRLVRLAGGQPDTLTALIGTWEAQSIHLREEGRRARLLHPRMMDRGESGIECGLEQECPGIGPENGRDASTSRVRAARDQTRTRSPPPARLNRCGVAGPRPWPAAALVTDDARTRATTLSNGQARRTHARVLNPLLLSPGCQDPCTKARDHFFLVRNRPCQKSFPPGMVR